MTPAVVAIVSAIALSRVGSNPVLISTQAEQLAADIRHVQTLAMTQGQRYRINLTATGYAFTLADARGTPMVHSLTGSTAQINWNSGIAIALPPTGLLSL